MFFRDLFPPSVKKFWGTSDYLGYRGMLDCQPCRYSKEGEIEWGVGTPSFSSSLGCRVKGVGSNSDLTPTIELFSHVIYLKHHLPKISFQMPHSSTSKNFRTCIDD